VILFTAHDIDRANVLTSSLRSTPSLRTRASSAGQPFAFSISCKLATPSRDSLLSSFAQNFAWHSASARLRCAACKIARDSTGAMNSGMERRDITSNENKMSCCDRESAWDRVEVCKSCKMSRTPGRSQLDRMVRCVMVHRGHSLLSTRQQGPVSISTAAFLRLSIVSSDSDSRSNLLVRFENDSLNTLNERSC
jgi:hypothetical protein